MAKRASSDPDNKLIWRVARLIEGLPDPSPFLALIRVHSLVRIKFERICGIHFARWRLLHGVARARQISQADLAASTTMEQAVLTRTFSEMQRKGLVERNPDPDDKRKLLVSLTPEGVELVEDVAEKRNVFMELALKGLSSEDVTTLETLLQRIEKNLEDL